jgi:hypothetical protein
VHEEGEDSVMGHCLLKKDLNLLPTSLPLGCQEADSKQTFLPQPPPWQEQPQEWSRLHVKHDNKLIICWTPLLHLNSRHTCEGQHDSCSQRQGLAQIADILQKHSKQLFANQL